MSSSHRSLLILQTNPPKEIIQQGEETYTERLRETAYVNVCSPNTSNTLLQGQQPMLGLHTTSSVGLIARSVDRAMRVYRTTSLHG